jgi:Tfp pilus assembly protein PilO
MSQSRIWAGGAAAVAIFMVLASYFLLISPKMGQASDLRAQKVSAQQSNDQLKLDVAQLKAQYATLPARQAELAVIKQQMPGTPNLPTLIRSLSLMATEAGVTLVSISPSTPASVASTGTGSTTAATPPSGLYAIPVAINVQGDYASSELFLQKLQTQMRRSYLVQGLSITPGVQLPEPYTQPTNGDVAVAVTGEVFVLQPSATTGTTGTTGSTTGAASSTTTPASAGSAN